jgi:peptide subunit release factor 1 (eRF1)
LEEKESLIDEFNKLANEKGAKLEVISDNTEEGMMLYKGFGGIADFIDIGCIQEKFHMTISYISSSL